MDQLTVLRNVLHYFNKDEVTVPKDLYEDVSYAVKEAMEKQRNSNLRDGCGSTVMVEPSVFEKAINTAVEGAAIAKNMQLSLLKEAGNIMLEGAKSLSKDQYDQMLATMIEVYRKTANI